MGRLSIDAMRSYLGRSIASLNENKLRGLLAEIDFRKRLGNSVSLIVFQSAVGLPGELVPGNSRIRLPHFSPK
jgi:hypothetical protein